MSESPEPSIDRSLLLRIVKAVELPVAATEPEAERLLACLGEIIRLVIRRAPTGPRMTQRQMDEVMKAHDTFHELLASFQDSWNAPPPLSTKSLQSGAPVSPWTRWRDRTRFEADDQLNWNAVGELIAVYEALFAETVATANEDVGESRPLAFLRETFAVVRELVPAEVRDCDRYYYIAPSNSSLNKRLKRLRRDEILSGEALVRRFIPSDSQ